MAACQFVYEEKYITKYDIHPLKVTSFTNQNNHQADHHSLVGHTFVRPRTKFVDFHVKTIFICISLVMGLDRCVFGLFVVFTASYKYCGRQM